MRLAMLHHRPALSGTQGEQERVLRSWKAKLLSLFLTALAIASTSAAPTACSVAVTSRAPRDRNHYCPHCAEEVRPAARKFLEQKSCRKGQGQAGSQPQNLRPSLGGRGTQGSLAPQGAREQEVQGPRGLSCLTSPPSWILPKQSQPQAHQNHKHSTL